MHEISQNFWSTQQAWTWAGLRPIRTIGFDKLPVGRAKLDCFKQRASCKTLSLKHGVTLWNMAWLSLKHGVTLSENVAWRSLELSLGSWLSGTSLFNIAGAALVTPLPSRALTWTLSRHRLNQPSIRRLEGTTSKNNELNAYGRKQPHLSCFHPRAPGDARTNPRGSRAQRPEQPFEGNETTSNLLLVNKQVHSN